MSEVIWPAPLVNPSKYPFYVHAPSFLAASTCRYLIDYFQSNEEGRWEHATGENFVMCSQAFLEPDDMPGIYSRIGTKVASVNQELWRFSIVGMTERMRIIQYGLGDGNDWHDDHNEIDESKLAFVVPLNSGYEGGELQLLDKPDVPELKRGDLLIFPAYVAHRVTRVTKGTRYSMTGWMAGPRYT